MDDGKSDENRRGGGARLLALLLALTCTLGWAAAAPHEATADEGDTLYCLNPTDVKIRPYAGTGTVTDVGQVQLVPNDKVFNSVDFVGAKIDGNWTIVDPATCKAVTVELVYSQYRIKTEYVRADSSERNPHSGIGVGFDGSMVDSDGRLWFTTTNDGDVHASETYRFSHIAGYANNDTGTNAYEMIFSDGFKGYVEDVEKHYEGTVLLGHRVTETPSTAGTVINQSPTAGAPVSDLTIPALAVGGGLAALGFGLSRRRRA